VLVTVVLLLALTVPGLAKKKTNFSFAYEFYNVNWDTNYADGTFSDLIAGDIEMAEGDAVIHWIPGTIWQGTMFIFDDILEPSNSFVVRFTISKDEGNDCGSGHYQIINFRGEGTFETMWGNGDMTICRPGGGDYVYGDLNGWVDFGED
jgi:hypothetical protein